MTRLRRSCESNQRGSRNESCPYRYQAVGRKVVNLLSEEELRWALAYKMWADGMDLEGEVPCIMDPADKFWTRECVEGYLVRVFGFKKVEV